MQFHTFAKVFNNYVYIRENIHEVHFNITKFTVCFMISSVVDLTTVATTSKNYVELCSLFLQMFLEIYDPQLYVTREWRFSAVAYTLINYFNDDTTTIFRSKFLTGRVVHLLKNLLLKNLPY